MVVAVVAQVELHQIPPFLGGDGCLCASDPHQRREYFQLLGEISDFVYLILSLFHHKRRPPSSNSFFNTCDKKHCYIININKSVLFFNRRIWTFQVILQLQDFKHTRISEER